MTPAERENLINETLPLIKHIAHRVATRLPANIEMRDLINAGVIVSCCVSLRPTQSLKSMGAWCPSGAPRTIGQFGSHPSAKQEAG